MRMKKTGERPIPSNYWEAENRKASGSWLGRAQKADLNWNQRNLYHRILKSLWTFLFQIYRNDGKRDLNKNIGWKICRSWNSILTPGDWETACILPQHIFARSFYEDNERWVGEVSALETFRVHTPQTIKKLILYWLQMLRTSKSNPFGLHFPGD